MKNKISGQSIVELVFAVGVIVLVITGVVALSVSNVNVKNKGFDRKKATELSQLIIEDLIDKKKNDSTEFWKLSNVTDQKWTGTEYANYLYSVGFTNVTTEDNPKCGIGVTDCTYVVIEVGWSGSGVGGTNSVFFNRFFSKQGD